MMVVIWYYDRDCICLRYFYILWKLNLALILVELTNLFISREANINT